MEYKDIPGYEGVYGISTTGVVKRLDEVGFKPATLLKTCKSPQGYLQTTLSRYGISTNFLIHTLLAMTYMDHIPNKHAQIIRFIDGVKTNVSLKNLVVEDTNYNHYPPGVSFSKQRGKYSAQISIDNVRIFLGHYGSSELAHQRYLRAKEYDGGPIENIRLFRKAVRVFSL